VHITSKHCQQKTKPKPQKTIHVSKLDKSGNVIAQMSGDRQTDRHAHHNVYSLTGGRVTKEYHIPFLYVESGQCDIYSFTSESITRDILSLYWLVLSLTT